MTGGAHFARRLRRCVVALSLAALALVFLATTSSGHAVLHAAGVREPAASASASLPTTDPGAWHKVFDDEFNGSALNAAKWNPDWFGTGTILPSFGQSSSDESCTSPAQVTEDGGGLHLGVAAGGCKLDNGYTYPYAGSLINTRGKFQFTYGYLEARIWVPTDSHGNLINSLSFWADGTGTWPQTGELDVMELTQGCGRRGSPGFAFHFHSPSGSPGACVTSHSYGGWHTFAANWQPGKVTYYYDGQNVGSITQGVTAAPMYLILSQSVDSMAAGSTTLAPAWALVDWVRVWQRGAARRTAGGR